jgi:hypothetical protein
MPNMTYGFCEVSRMTELTALAKLALATLNQQQAYFKSRSFADLGASKNLEQQLREAATLALAQATPPTLFDGDDNG